MDRQDFFKNSDKNSTGPLQGLLILEATTTWPGPPDGISSRYVQL